MRPTTSRGMPAGPHRQVQEDMSKPGSVSAMAGVSGTTGLRASEVTPSARTRPSRACASAPGYRC